MAYPPIPDPTADMLTWALWYAAQGWPVFPCHGKAPFLKGGFQIATCEAAQITSWWGQWPTCNIGSPIQPGSLVLDIDPRNGGDDTLYHLEQAYGALPPTLTSHTGGGGWHKWVITPRPIRNKAHLGDGIDVQGVGSYVILPPSLHPETGNRYLWDVEYGIDDIRPQEAPEWLVVLLEAETRHRSQDRTPGQRRAPGEPIPEGRRESTLMQLAGAMQRIGATQEAIRAALDAENQRCLPPLETADLDRMTHSVGRYAPEPTLHVNQAPVGWSGQPQQATISGGWRSELFCKKSNSELFQNVFNISQILAHHEQWHQPHNQLWWDSVRGTPMCGNIEITDSIMMDIATWFGGAQRLPITSLRLLEKCVIAHCQKHARDLLQIWLNTLPPWDQQPRLTSWLTAIAGVTDTAYAREVSQVLIVSMVARAMQPGCQYRYVVIFVGNEEIGKSTLVRELAHPDWYVELSIGLESKEAHMMLQGAWVAELSELDTLSRTEEPRLKAFITMREDSYIPKYSNFRQRTQRRAIFIGTTNEPTFLKGLSGNTRYLPLQLPLPIDLAQFCAMRTQLFAEALLYYHAHPDDWWQLSPDALDTARDEREQRRVESVYEHPLHEWLEYGRFAEVVFDQGTPVSFVKEETSWPEIARWFLKLDTPEKWKDRSLQMQIASALKGLGWAVKQARRNGRNMKIWQKEPTHV